MLQKETMKQGWPTQWRYLCLFVVHFVLMAGNCSAQWFLEDAELVDVRVGSLSDEVDALAKGSGLLSDGRTFSFDRWYSSTWVDLRFTFMTPVSKNLGIYWGFGTGERGEKFRIDPSIKLGFLAIEPITENSQLSLSVSVVIGGYLREKTCTADYGAIGGVQTVNCRLADSLLPPAETLNYLLDKRPGDRVSATLRYQLKF
jgi:hypothetical protein